MNERIQALVEQATSRPHRDQGVGGEPTHIYPGTFSVEKFAQLVIADTAQRIVTELRRLQADYDDPVSYCDTEYYVRMQAKSDAMRDAIDIVEHLSQEK